MKYEVSYTTTQRHETEVEAESKEEAKNKATEEIELITNFYDDDYKINKIKEVK